MTEADFIAALRALPLHAGARGLLDDAAVLELGGETLILTHDMIAEGVHYLPGTDPFYIAWKLVAVNLSDLAAKGASPLGVLIGASLIEGSERFVEGLRTILDEFGVPLLGGDTIRPEGPASFGCTAIGRATTVPVPRRSGARAGDRLFLAGSIGVARQGYEQCARGSGMLVTGPVEAYLKPRPLIAEGIALAPHATAMMDVSDGLLLDARRMAEASGVTINLISEATWIATADPFRMPGDAYREAWIDAASWGDDYALILATSERLEAMAQPAAFAGYVMERGTHALLVDGAPLSDDRRLGYEHR